MAALYRRPDDETSERVLFDFELKKARNNSIGDGSASKMTHESPGMAPGSSSREVQHEDPTADRHLRGFVHRRHAAGASSRRPHEAAEADANGEPLYSVELVCIGTEGDEILSVTFPGPPPAGIRQGMPVRVTGLMVTGGAIGDRFGLTFRAADIEPLSAADAETGRQPSSGAAGLNR